MLSQAPSPSLGSLGKYSITKLHPSPETTTLIQAPKHLGKDELAHQWAQGPKQDLIQQTSIMSGVVAQSCNPSTWGGEAIEFA